MSSDMFEVFNFDEIIPNEDEDNSHPLVPRWPFNMLISGGTGCGKTTTLINLLLKQLEYDSIFLYSRDLSEDKYEMLEKICQASNIEFTWTNDLTQIIDIDELNPEYRHCIIFDDLVNEKNKGIIKKIEDCFIRGRKRNASSFYLSHQFYKTPKLIRDNCQYFIIFKGSRRDRTELFKTFGDELESEEFYKLYDKALKSKYSFFMIDRKTNKDQYRYRAGFDGIIFKPDNDND